MCVCSWCVLHNRSHRCICLSYASIKKGLVVGLKSDIFLYTPSPPSPPSTPLPPLPPPRLAHGGFLGVKRKLVMPLNILLTHTPHILTTPIVSFLLECMLRVCGFDHYFFLLSLLQPPPFVFPCNIVVKPYPILPFRSRCIVCEYCI